MKGENLVALDTKDSAPQAAISVAGVSKTYLVRNTPRLVLRDIDLEVAAGEFLVLLGPSGSGKTTLMRIIGGLVEASQGSVVLDGVARKPNSGAAPGLGFVFQDPNLMPWRTVQGNIALPLQLSKTPKAEKARIVGDLLDLIGLQDFADAYPRQLSGGMRQRVAIARALACDPSFLLMDEPFGALDAMTRDTMGLELQRLWMERRKTVVFVTHSIPEAVFLADRIAVLTAHPGTIESIITVPFPRPRSLDVLDNPEFTSLVQGLRKKLERPDDK